MLTLCLYIALISLKTLVSALHFVPKSWQNEFYKTKQQTPQILSFHPFAQNLQRFLFSYFIVGILCQVKFSLRREEERMEGWDVILQEERWWETEADAVFFDGSHFSCEAGIEGLSFGWEVVVRSGRSEEHEHSEWLLS